MRANEMDLRPVGNAVNVHFLNALSETDESDVSEVDFYALGDDDSLSGSSPVLSGVGYLQGSSVVLDAKSYRFLITTANTHSILAGPEPLAAPQGRAKYIVTASKENHRGWQGGNSQLFALEFRHRSTITSALANKDISRWNRR